MLEPTSRVLWGRGEGCLVKLEPISKALWGRGAGCSSGVGTYLQGTVGQVCRLFTWCGNLPPVHCGAAVQVVQVVLEPTSGALWGRCAGCLSGVETYLKGTVRQWCRLFKWCRKLPHGHFWAGVQAV